MRALDRLAITRRDRDGHVARRLRVGQVPRRARVAVARSELGKDGVGGDPGVCTGESAVAVANRAFQARTATCTVGAAPGAHTERVFGHVDSVGRGARRQIGTEFGRSLRLAIRRSTHAGVYVYEAKACYENRCQGAVRRR